MGAAVLTFVFIGMLVGAASVYFGYAAWVLAAVLLFASANTKPILAAVGGASTGIGSGAAALLWFGSQCPVATSCEPAFNVVPYLVFIGTALAIGVACLVTVVVRRPMD